MSGERSKTSPIRQRCALSGLLLILIWAGNNQTGATAESRPLTVFAASSLTNAFNAMGEELRGSRPSLKVQFNYGASSALRSQIQLGAAADVFASADYDQMRPLRKAGLIEEPKTFARNRLTLVVPRENRARLGSPRDLARGGLRLVTTSEAVPVGHYTQRLFFNLAQLPGYPADFAARCNASVVSREPNVRSVLAKAELGEADAAIVYETDARASTRVRRIPIPEGANVIAEYPVAILTGSSNRVDAARFVGFLKSERGRSILKRFGFR